MQQQPSFDSNMTPMHCIAEQKKRTAVTVVTTQFMFESKWRTNKYYSSAYLRVVFSSRQISVNRSNLHWLVRWRVTTSAREREKMKPYWQMKRCEKFLLNDKHVWKMNLLLFLLKQEKSSCYVYRSEVLEHFFFFCSRSIFLF